MRYRDLGTTGLRLSELGFGCSRIASLITSHTPREIAATLAAALEAGVTFFDTADVYGQGDSERLLAKVFRGQRQRVVIGTKAGLKLTAPQAAIRWLKPVLSPWLRRSRAGQHATALRERVEQQCFRPEWIRRRLHSSLRRLRTDYLDIFVLHSPPVGLPQFDSILREMDALRRAGTVRCFGVSCAQLEDARYWLDTDSIGCLQVPMLGRASPASDALLQRAAARGVGIVAREVLGGTRGRNGETGDIAAAFAAVLDRPEVTSALAGMSCRAHLQDNLAAVRCAARGSA